MMRSIVFKFSFASVLMLLVSIGIMAWIFYAKTTNLLVNEALKDISINVLEAGDKMEAVVKNLNGDILFLANTRPIQGIIKARLAGGADTQGETNYTQWNEQLDSIFRSLLERKLKYHKIRFIDQQGNELVSVYRDTAEIKSEKADKLQNKAHRPYVKETRKLTVGKTYVSDINLNREFGVISIPYQEVIRITTPIYDEKAHTFAGLLVITFDIGRELREIQLRANKHNKGIIYITNDQGQYLLHPDKNKTFGFDLQKNHQIQEDIPQIAPSFLAENVVQHQTLMPKDTDDNKVVNFKKIHLDFYDQSRFIMVIMVQDYRSIVAQAYETMSDIKYWIILLVLVGVIPTILFSIRLTRPLQKITEILNNFDYKTQSTLALPSHLKDEVGVLARSFDSMFHQIKKSHQELEDLNENLEQRIDKRTEESNKARLEAERANLAKSEFLSNMSHEFRTPLNAILGFSQLLQLDPQNIEHNQMIDIQEIYKAGNHLLNLVNDVLDLAKIESGKLDMTLQTVVVDDIMQQCFSLIQPLATSHHVELIDNGSGGYKVLADEVRLKQVLVNLLSNAVKYNCDHGQITVGSEVTNDRHLRIRVTDTGEGLSKDNINKLFRPFERLNKEVDIEGAGIGLVITKHLVELMGGEIGVESQLEKGSTFWVELALEE